MFRRFLILTGAFLFFTVSISQAQYDIMDSGGELRRDQAVYDTYYHNLNFTIHPETKSIEAKTSMYARIITNTRWLVVDFDTMFTVTELGFASSRGQGIFIDAFDMSTGMMIVQLSDFVRTGDYIRLDITYHGAPRVAQNPPWDGGFTWSETSDGQPFIGVSCQGNGANIWWPNKDHPSDRADSVSINIRVPDPLIAVSNGHSRGQTSHGDGTTTWHWHNSTPINNYAVSINVAPYEVIEREFTSVTGESVPVYFWALPENISKAEILLEDIESQFKHFEKLLGPYPFRADKYGVVESPYFGMEHQTLIAYGAGYKNDAIFNSGSEFDDLHHHELAHEWWGNLVAADDWKDFWIHEGFGTYMQPLYAEYLHGSQQYRHFMNVIKQRINNDYAIAPPTSMTAGEMFRGRDVYMKGAWVLHMLRYITGDEVFFEALRRFAYPTEESELVTDGRQSRHASTNEFISHMEYYADMELDWFFDLYLRQPELPELIINQTGRKLAVYWKTSDNLPFMMPVEIEINGDIRKYQISNELKTIRLPRRLFRETEVVIDPHDWILRK